MLSELVRQHPSVDGRFEAGLLLGKTPAEFPRHRPFPQFVMDFWGLDHGGILELSRCKTFPEMYELLREHSNLEDKTVQIYDKAPAYMRDLPNVMGRMPDVPVVVIVKDVRAVWGSIKRRRPSANIGPTAELWARHTEGYERAKELYPDRILLVRNEELCLNPTVEGRRIYDFLGLEWKDEYAGLNNVYKLHNNIYGNEDRTGCSRGIVADRITEWKQSVTPEEEEELALLTKDGAAKWYWRD
jgi:hypothetical protein